MENLKAKPSQPTDISQRRGRVATRIPWTAGTPYLGRRERQTSDGGKDLICPGIPNLGHLERPEILGTSNLGGRDRQTLDAGNNHRRSGTPKLGTSDLGSRPGTPNLGCRVHNLGCRKSQTLEAGDTKPQRLGTPNLRHWTPIPQATSPLTPTLCTLGRKSRPFCYCQLVELLLIITN